MNERAQPLDVAQARGVQHRPAPQNSRLFSMAWLTQWKSAAVMPARQHAEAVSAKQLGEAEADGDDADVLDRRIGQHT